jgi:methionyl-tRNA formyltransferase
MMKIVLICSSDIMALPAALQLRSAGMLAAIAIPAKHGERLLSSFMQAGFEKQLIHTVNKETLADELATLFKHAEADTAMVITFPWKIPSSVLSMVPNGCFNFHPGLLPKYKGSDPIFWQLRNREPKAGLTIHLMTDEIDAGPIVMLQEMDLMAGETYGIHAQRIALLIVDTILKAVDVIEQSAGSFSKQQPLPQLLFHKKPGFEDLHIDWSKQTASEIEALVNASNPKIQWSYHQHSRQANAYTGTEHC